MAYVALGAGLRSAWQARAARGVDGLLWFGWTGTVVCCLVAVLVSFFLAGYWNPYWRRADMDYFIVYQAFLLNDGRPQSYFDHPGYFSIVLLDLWFRLLHGLGALDVIALSGIPPASDAAGFERVWTAAVRAGRLLSLVLVLSFIAAFAFLIRRLIADWRIAALAVCVLAFSSGIMFHSRILRTELLAAGLCTLGLLLLLLAARSPGAWWRFLLVGLAAMLCTLGVVNKVQAVFAAVAWPVVMMMFGVRSEAPGRVWQRPAYAAAILLGLSALTIAAAIPAANLIAAAFAERGSSVFSLPPPPFGVLGLYQALLAGYVASAIIVFAVLWRVGMLETLATLLAVALGVAVGLLSMTLRHHPQNAISVVNFLELMLAWASASDGALRADGGAAVMRLFWKVLVGVYEVLAHYTFVLHTSSRATMFLQWIVLAGMVLAWRRGHRLLVGQVAMLLLAAFGLDLVATFRGAKIEYGIFADCLIILAAAWLLGQLPSLLEHRRAFVIGALFIAIMVPIGQFEVVKAAWLSRAGPESTCQWVGHYVSLVERFPYCPAKP
jgi:hypothetical protein